MASSFCPSLLLSSINFRSSCLVNKVKSSLHHLLKQSLNLPLVVHSKQRLTGQTTTTTTADTILSVCFITGRHFAPETGTRVRQIGGIVSSACRHSLQLSVFPPHTVWAATMSSLSPPLFRRGSREIVPNKAHLAAASHIFYINDYT